MRKTTTITFSLILMIGLFFFAGCTSSGSTEKDSEKIKIVTTFYPMYDFTKNIVGDEAEVSILIPAGTETHDYEPSAKDMAKISDADFLVYNSKELETWVPDALDSIGGTNKLTVIEASSKIALMESTSHDHEDDHEHDEEEEHNHELDPHVWLNPVLAKTEVETIRDQLVEKYPEKKAVFEENAASYLEKLSNLDRSYQEAFKEAEKRTFVTQHAAFSYLAKQYNLTQTSIAGLSPDQEPTPSRLAELKKYVKENDISVIYFEASASSKVAETLAKETGVELAVLNPLEGLTNKEQEAGKDYISVMEENLEALKKSIQ